MSTAASWYAARGAGLVAYVLVTTTVLLGVTLAARRVRVLPRFALEDVHRFIGLLTGVFVAIHVLGIALDKVVPFSLTQIVVPFTASYRPLWTGIGVVALELLLALAITNRLRGRLPHRVWRTIHGGSFAIWTLATLHGVLSGTDRDTTWARLLYAVAVSSVIAGVGVRLSRDRPLRSALLAGGALGAAAAIAVVALTTVPMPSAGATSGRIQAAEAPWRLSGPFSGRIDERDGPDAVLVSVSGSADADGRTAMRLDLLETRDGTETALQILFPTGASCTGTVAAVDRTGFAGTCTTADGSDRRVEAAWTVAGREVHGTIDVASADGASSNT